MNRYYLSNDAPRPQNLKKADGYWAFPVLVAEQELASGASAPLQLPATYFLRDVLGLLELLLRTALIHDVTTPATVLGSSLPEPPQSIPRHQTLETLQQSEGTVNFGSSTIHRHIMERPEI